MKIKIVKIIIIMLLLLGTFLCLRWPRTVPLHKCSQVYQRYVGHEGIAAAYIQDFRVNDTLTIAVTLLQATDSAGWEYLKQEFNMPAGMIQVAGLNPAFDIWVWQIVKGHPEARYDANVNDGCDTVEIEMVSTSFSKQEVCVFHIRNRQEWDAVSNNRLESNCITIDK